MYVDHDGAIEMCDQHSDIADQFETFGSLDYPYRLPDAPPLQDLGQLAVAVNCSLARQPCAGLDNFCSSFRSRKNANARRLVA